MAKKVVVVGGGIAGCSAAVAAAKAGADTVLLERTDMLGGCALFAGRVDHKYFTVREELQLMGCDGVFEVFEQCKIHDKVEFPFPADDVKNYGNVRKMLYDVNKLDLLLYHYLRDAGVEVRLEARVKDIDIDGKCLRAVITADGSKIEGDAFVDATGGAGGVDKCNEYGKGCAMCFMRCPSFGGRVSLVAKAGVKELIGKKKDGSLGPITAAYSLVKESIDPDIRAALETNGMVTIPIPSSVVDYKRTEDITASAHLEKGFAENVILVDIGGFAKRIAGGYQPLWELRQIPGFSRARYADPIAASIGNAVRYLAISPRDYAQKVPGLNNLFIAGEKASVNGLGEVIVSGVLSGHNAAREATGLEMLVIPTNTEVGDFLAYITDNWDSEEGLRFRFHLFTGPYFKRAYDKGLYTEDRAKIEKRVEEAGLAGVFDRKLT